MRRMMRITPRHSKPASWSPGLMIAGLIVLFTYHTGNLHWYWILGSLVLAGLVDSALGVAEVDVPKRDLKTKTRYVPKEDL